jgi:hypothetical protein
MVEFSQKIELSRDVLIQEVEGESILLNLGNDQYYGLNIVGARMLQLLIQRPSIQKAFTALQDEYAVDHRELMADLQALIDDLLREGLIVLV